MINQFNRSFELPLENADAFKRMTKLEPDLLQCLIEDPKDGLTSGDRALRVQPATPKNPQATDAEFDKIWQNYDVWVDVMCHFLWIRSPALEFTLRRARDRYRQFFQLLATNPTPSLAPTPDVELVWLTHQSSPLSFELFSKFSVGRLVEHNAVPHDHSYQQALLSTEQAFRAYFGTAYRQCLCWDCQNLQRVAEQSLSEIEGTQQLVQKSMRQVAYHRAVEHARRDRRILPVAQ